MAPLTLWPCALDVVENGADFRIAQHVGEAWHVTLVAATDDRGRAFLHDAEQNVVGMVPGVAAGVMRWCGQSARRKRGAPVGLALQIHSVAGGALIGIDLSALRDDIRRHTGRSLGTCIVPTGKDREDQAPDDQTARYFSPEETLQYARPRRL